MRLFINGSSIRSADQYHLGAPREPLVILTKFLRHLWSIIERMHGKEESIYWIDSKNKNHQNMCIIRLIIEELSEIWLKTITLPDVEMKQDWS